MELIASLLIISLASIASLKYRWLGWASLVGVVILVPSQPAILLLAFLIILNMLSLELMKRSYLAGVDYGLVAFMAAATIYAIYSTDLSSLVAAFVAVSVPTYMLVMASEERARTDTGIKYITFMVLATVLFLIGVALAVFASQTGDETLYAIAFVAIVVGIAIEVGVAPFHQWVPDVFVSADAIPISIIASLAKFVPFIVAFKILSATYMGNGTLIMVVAFLAIISMFAGNIGALTSREHSRILGYSTVANMGYILATFVILSKPEFLWIAFAGALLQLFANSFGKVGFFAAIKDGGSSPALTYTLALSFIGMPPLMGFWSKVLIISSLAYSGFIWLAVIMVINSAISVPYYIRLARELGAKDIRGLAGLVVALTVIATLLTLLPGWFIDSAKALTAFIGLGGV
jgi:NADH-quinone oxidoreductase subunit N